MNMKFNSLFLICFFLILNSISTKKLKIKNDKPFSKQSCVEFTLIDTSNASAACVFPGGYGLVKFNLSNEITNIDGQLTLGLEGNFDKTCSECKFEQTVSSLILNCNCAKRNHELINSKLELADAIQFSNVAPYIELKF